MGIKMKNNKETRYSIADEIIKLMPELSAVQLLGSCWNLKNYVRKKSLIKIRDKLRILLKEVK